jgi:hypothetical protein
VCIACQRPESPGAEELQARLLELADQYHTLQVLCEAHAAIDLPFVSVTADKLDYPLAAGFARRVRNELGLLRLPPRGGSQVGGRQTPEGPRGRTAGRM